MNLNLLLLTSSHLTQRKLSFAIHFIIYLLFIYIFILDKQEKGFLQAIFKKNNK